MWSKVLELSSEVSECKPLPLGVVQRRSEWGPFPPPPGPPPPPNQKSLAWWQRLATPFVAISVAAALSFANPAYVDKGREFLLLQIYQRGVRTHSLLVVRSADAQPPPLPPPPPAPPPLQAQYHLTIKKHTSSQRISAAASHSARLILQRLTQRKSHTWSPTPTPTPAPRPPKPLNPR